MPNAHSQAPPPSLTPSLPPPQPLPAHNSLSSCVELTECLLLLIEQVLAGDTELLQVRFSQASTSKAGVRDVCGGDVCYLISQDVRELLHLTGPREHLWSLLRKHSQHQHTDRHLATHVAHVWREEVRARMIGSTLTNSSSPLSRMMNHPPPTLAKHSRLLTDAMSLARCPWLSSSPPCLPVDLPSRLAACPLAPQPFSRPPD